MHTNRPLLAALLGLTMGCAIAYVDARPVWDDTGITALAVVVAAAAAAAIHPRTFWLAAITVALPVFAMNVLLNANYGAALAIVIAFIGASAGAAAVSAVTFAP